MLIPLAAQVATDVSNTQASRVFNWCFLLPQIMVSTTVATPFRKKNSPTRIRPSLRRIGCNAYMWNTLISVNAPITPMALAMLSGSPIFGSPYLKGQYARDVQGDEKALCHVSDLLSCSVYGLRYTREEEMSTRILTETLQHIMVQTMPG